MKKWVYFIVVVFVAAMAYLGIFMNLNERETISTIGGADGPTAIVVGKAADETISANETIPANETETVELETSECANSELEETKEEASDSAVEDHVLTEEELDRKVAEIILEHSKSVYTGEECQAEGHIVLEYEVEEGTTTVYALTMYGEYQFQNVDYFIKASGSGVIPAVLSFGTDRNGEEFITIEWPDEGSGYNESVKKMFPEYLWDRVLVIKEEDRKSLQDMERVYAEEYLNMMGRDAIIGEYADVERTYFTDYGISVEVSNKMNANEKYMGPYPAWVGSLEKIENGERYMYSVFVDDEVDQIIYEKRFFETHETVEKFVFDAETGEPIEN